MRALSFDEEAARLGWTVRHSAVPGRVRISIPQIKRAPLIRARLESDLPGRAGIRTVSGSEWSGSLLIVFDPSRTATAILDAVAALLSGGSDSLSRSPESAKRDRVQAAEQRGPSAPPATPGPARQPAGGWHARSVDAVATVLRSDPRQGLTSEDARTRLARDGPNRLRGVKHRSRLAVALDQFADLPVMLLLGSAGISVVTGGIADAVAIVGIVAINAVIGYATERQAARTIAEMVRPSQTHATVRRDGRRQKVPEAELVRGDVIFLEPGYYVPADARLVTTDSLTIDESALTGESEAARKAVACPTDPRVPLADRRNMVYKGTIITSGAGRAIVTATGMDTEIGRIQALADTASAPPTPSQRQLDRLGRQLALASGGVCVGVFALGLLRGSGLLAMLKSSIALAVAAVPEGLPAMAVTTLALGVRDMRKRGVLVRRLPAVETLGSVQTICLDKTGTITLNRMTVREIRTRTYTVRLTNGVSELAANRPETGARSALRGMLEVGALCSDAKFASRDGDGDIDGSSTESALLRAATAAGLDVVGLRRAHPRRHTRYRSDGHHYMCTRHDTPDGRILTAVKGNPAEVLAFCDSYLTDDGVRPLTSDDRAAIERANAQMAGAGQRVLAFARAISDAGAEMRACPDQTPLVWLGLVGLTDPLRPGIKQVIRHFHEAGIDTVMITGDQRATAAAIARELDLGGGAEIQVVDARDLVHRDATELGRLVEAAQVFSRVSPATKLDVVRALQARGRVVSMTGDGVNDSPALKAADIGIAMGRSGTPIARDVAAIVLREDNLEDMVVAIHRGRTIYRNVRKSIRFLLSTNASEILVVLAATAAGQPAPLTAMQLLWINLASDVFPALGLALEPPDSLIMRTPPRDPGEPILRRKDLRRIGRESLVIGAGSLGGYAWALGRYGPGLQAQTVACLGLITGQLLHAVTCRSRRSVFDRPRGWRPRNPYLDVALAGTFGLQALVAAVPALRRFFGFAPLGPLGYGVALAAGVVPFLVNNLLKGREDMPRDEPAAPPAAGIASPVGWVG